MKKSINGNGNNSLNIVHWNLGSKFWINKIEEIQLLVDDYGADIYFISESNLWAGTPQHETLIEGYEIIMPKTMHRYNYCRIIALVKDEFQ